MGPHGGRKRKGERRFQNGWCVQWAGEGWRKSEGRKNAEGRNPNMIGWVLRKVKWRKEWTLRASAKRSLMFVATFRAKSRASPGAACRPTMPCHEPAVPLLAELDNKLLGQTGYRHGAPNGAIRPAQESEMRRRGAAPRARYPRGPRLTVPRVHGHPALVAASRAGYFGLRVSAFFRVSDFGLRVWGTDSSSDRELTVPSYGVFRRTVSRCAQSGFGSG